MEQQNKSWSLKFSICITFSDLSQPCCCFCRRCHSRDHQLRKRIRITKRGLLPSVDVNHCPSVDVDHVQELNHDVTHEEGNDQEGELEKNLEFYKNKKLN